MKLTQVAVSLAIIFALLSVAYSTDFVKGDLKPRSFFFKRIHTQTDKPRIIVSSSAATTVYGFAPEQYTNYKTKQPFTAIHELTQFGASYVSQIVPSTYPEVVIVVENRDYTNVLHFSITVMKASDPVSNTLSIVDNDDETTTSDAQISITSGSTSTSTGSNANTGSDSQLDASVNSPYLPHLTRAHMAQIALCAFASRYHFPLCHHVVKHTLSGEGYKSIPHAAFSQDSTSYSANTLAADGTTTPASTTTTNPSTTSTTPDHASNIVVNVSSGDTAIFVTLLVVIVLMWAALLLIIIKLGKDGHLAPEGYATPSYQKVSSVN